MWYDPEHTTFMSLDLHNAIWELRSKALEITELKQINDLLSSENKEKVLVLKAQEKDLEEKNKQLVLLANKFSLGNRCSFFFLLWLSNVTCWLVLWPDVSCQVTYPCNVSNGTISMLSAAISH